MSRHRGSRGYIDDEHRYSSSRTRPLSQYPELARDTDKENFRTVVRPEREREIKHRDRPPRRRYDDYGDMSKHNGTRYHHHEGRSCRPRGRSLHNEDVVEHRRRGHRPSGNTRAHSEHRLVEAATAALAAGVTEAVRARHDPNRSRRAVTAAVSAAAVDALASKGDEPKRGRHLVESAVSGLLIDRLANGRSGK
ncbi:hypothetical protein CCMA1212_007570 [Trichoderma ghanense]|uniref:Uncharacterized protein n=1 Tax=Trichoderma ghanense TaxID=65468 RepID=A0ABY2GY32_9HYPO